MPRASGAETETSMRKLFLCIAATFALLAMAAAPASAKSRSVPVPNVACMQQAMAATGGTWQEAAGRCDPSTWIPCEVWARKCGGRCGEFRKVCPSCGIRGGELRQKLPSGAIGVASSTEIGLSAIRGG